MSKPAIIIGCGKLKHPRPLPAQHLYRSTYIRYAVGWAKSIGVTPYILSAKYGLIPGTLTIPPYNSSFLDGTEQTSVEQVREQLKRFGITGEVIAPAGERYRDVLRLADPALELSTPFYDLARERWGKGTQGYQVKTMRENWGRIPDKV